MDVKHTWFFTVSMLALLACAGSSATLASTRASSPDGSGAYIRSLQEREPLLVLRLSSRNAIYYQTHIHDLFGEVMRYYPDAFFDIVSVIPDAGHYAQTHENMLHAMENIETLEEMLETLQIPRRKYQVSYVTSSGAPDNEIRIYWRQRL